MLSKIFTIIAVVFSVMTVLVFIKGKNAETTIKKQVTQNKDELKRLIAKNNKDVKMLRVENIAWQKGIEKLLSTFSNYKQKVISNQDTLNLISKIKEENKKAETQITEQQQKINKNQNSLTELEQLKKIKKEVVVLKEELQVINNEKEVIQRQIAKLDVDNKKLKVKQNAILGASSKEDRDIKVKVYNIYRNQGFIIIAGGYEKGVHKGDVFVDTKDTKATFVITEVSRLYAIANIKKSPSQALNIRKGAVLSLVKP